MSVESIEMSGSLSVSHIILSQLAPFALLFVTVIVALSVWPATTAIVSMLISHAPHSTVRQSAEQPSPDTVFPSSQDSPFAVSKSPSPHQVAPSSMLQSELHTGQGSSVGSGDPG